MKFSWDFRYTNLLTSFLKATQETPSQFPDEAQMQLFSLISEFNSLSLEITKEIINDFLLPKYSQKYYQFLSNKTEIPINECEELFYDLKEKSLQIRICSNKGFSVIKLRKLKHEFKSLNVLADCLISIKQKKLNYDYYVPLACKICYKGFVALVKSTSFINKTNKNDRKEQNMPDKKENEANLMLGPTKEGHYFVNMPIHKDLILLAKTLNLQPHYYQCSKGEESLPLALSIFTQIYKLDAKSLMEFSAFHKLKSQKNLNFFTENLQNQETKNLEIFYLQNVADIFPLQLYGSNNINSFEQNRFRPEFLLQYSKPLSADLFLSSVHSTETEEMDKEGYLASDYLKSTVLSVYLKELKTPNIRNIPLSARGLRDSFHQNGINMRFLGDIASKCKNESCLKFLKEICEIDMIARVLKEIMDRKLNECFAKFEKKKFASSELANYSLGHNLTPCSDEKQKIQSFSEPVKEELNSENNINASTYVLDLETEFLLMLEEEVIDLFNLLFGKGRESEIFWREVLLKKILLKFDYSLELDNFQNFQVFNKFFQLRKKIKINLGFI